MLISCLNSVLLKILFVAVTSVDLYEAAIDEGIVDAETIGIYDFVDGSETVDGCLLVYILLYLLWLLLLPRGFDKAWDDGIDCGACAFKFLDEILCKGANSRLGYTIAQNCGMRVNRHLGTCEDNP